MISIFRQALVLMVANILAYLSLPLMMLVGSLVGARLAPDQTWATLPIASMIVGTAVGVLPATQLMQCFGRKPVFIGYCGLGIGTCLLAAGALQLSSFALFVAAALLLGMTVAAIQQLRFAAIETVGLEKAGIAASIIMCGGIVAAVAGPDLALLGRTITAIEYQGTFYLAAAGFLLSACVLLLGYRPPPTRQFGGRHAARSIAQIARNPEFLLAVASSVVGFAVMSFIMTGTPLSMHFHHGHSLEDTKWVLQSHLVAMFLPSLVAPWLFARLGNRPLMAVGLACYFFAGIYGYFDGSVMGFWWQLVALGVGWNFLFVGGTALLASTYRDGEQLKAQAFHDTAVFSLQSLAALSAGWAVNAISWSLVMLLALIPVFALAIAMLWERRVATAAVTVMLDD